MAKEPLKIPPGLFIFKKLNLCVPPHPPTEHPTIVPPG